MMMRTAILFFLFGVWSIGAATAQSSPSGSLSVSGYVRLTDPLEQAFSLDVPASWRSEGGLARRAALQINPYVRSLSPDKMAECERLAAEWNAMKIPEEIQ